MKIHPTIYLIVVILLLGGLFLVLRSKNKEGYKNNTNTSQSNPSSPQVSPLSNNKNFELVIKNKKLTSGLEILKVTEGENVVIKITCDEDEEFHLHGYDKSVELVKDKTVELSFNANLTGRFVYELEHSKTDIGVLEVSPR